MKLPPSATPALRAFERHKSISSVERHTGRRHGLDHYTGILSLQALARLAIVSGDEELIERARQELLPFVRGERDFPCNFPNYLCGGNGTAYLLSCGRLPEARAAVHRRAEETLLASARSHDGIITLPGLAGTDKVWIDAAFATTPFMLHAGLALGDPRYVDDAVNQTMRLIGILRDPANGLVHQARSFSKPGAGSEDHWSRGNGWAILALADLVDGLPADHARRKEVETAFVDLLAACLRVQNAEGLWHHEMTLPSSLVEISGSGLILHALGVGLARGLVQSGHRADFDRGLKGLLHYIDPDGSVRNTCEGCLSPGDGSIAAFLTKQPIDNDPHAFGPITLAFTAALMLEKTPTQPAIMNLDKLKAERATGGALAPLSLPELEICQRYEKVFTAAVNDALRERGLTLQTLPNHLVPLRDTMKAAGFAFTIKGAKSLELRNEMAQRAEMLDALTEHCFIAWDTSNDDESAQWGECMTMAALRKHCRGAVVDGGVRDTDRVLELGIPLWVRYRSSNGMLGRFRISGWQVCIRLGDVFVQPGDLIFADIDGAIVVPRALTVPVLLRAEEIANGESELKRWINEGMSAVEIVKRGGYF